MDGKKQAVNALTGTARQHPTQASSDPDMMLPPLKDEWKLTDLKDNLFPGGMIASAKKKFAQERCSPRMAQEFAHAAIMCTMSDGEGLDEEAKLFPHLFPNGTGHYASKYNGDKTPFFVEYLKDCLQQENSPFARDERWLAITCQITAFLRAMCSPPSEPDAVFGNEALRSNEILTIHQFYEMDPKKAFIFRYLIGDKQAFHAAYKYCLDEMKIMAEAFHRNDTNNNTSCCVCSHRNCIHNQERKKPAARKGVHEQRLEDSKEAEIKKMTNDLMELWR
jgi:hypothetical protein